MSKEKPEPTELDDKRLEEATGGLVSTVATFKPVLQARALNLKGGGGGGVSFGSVDTGIETDRNDPDVA
jgi:hypothetical protein